MHTDIHGNPNESGVTIGDVCACDVRNAMEAFNVDAAAQTVAVSPSFDAAPNLQTTTA